MNNRQLRTWVFMLYPDNPLHEKAINYIDLLDNSLYVKHIEKKLDDGTLLNKEHYHCVLRFDNPYWLSKLLDDLGLPSDDSHLFHSYKDFKDKNNKQKFKRLEDYVLYLDHMDNDDKPDKYDITDFHGGLVNWASSVFNSREKENYAVLSDLVEFIKKYNLEHFPDSMRFTFGDWFKISIENGYGSVFYKEWYKMRDILKSYLPY